MLRKNSDPSDQEKQIEDSHHGSEVSLSENDPRDAIGDFSVLPDEVIVSILELLEDKDLRQGISLASSYFWETCNKRFFDTLYGRSLRFSEWQETELVKLRENFGSFTDMHRITLFRPTNRSFGQNFQNYAMLAIAFLSLILVAHYFYSILRMSTRLDTSSYTGFFLLTALCMRMLQYAYRGCREIINAVNRTINQNTIFLQSPMTLQHLNELHQFISENKIFLSPRINQIIVGTTSISQLLNSLQQEIITIESLSNYFNDYLKSKKTSAKKFIDKDDFKILREINPELPGFAKNSSNLWRENNDKKESLIEIKDVTDEIINEDSQLSLSAAKSN